MTLTLRDDHLGIVLLAAAVLTTAGLGALLLTGRGRRSRSTWVAIAASFGATWLTVGLAVAARGPDTSKCLQRHVTTALGVELVSFVGRADRGFSHPLLLVVAGVVAVIGLVAALAGRRGPARQVGGAVVLVGVALAWLCVDNRMEGPIVLKLVRQTGPCRQVLPHGIVLADLAALLPLAGAAWLAGQVLKPWRWAHSSGPVVAQS